MLEVLQRVVPFAPSRERTLIKRQNDSLFDKGRWGFRYDPKHKEGWRQVSAEYRRMVESDPQAFRRHLLAQSPAEQYALLELLSQPAFGVVHNEDIKPQIEPKDIGELYAGLIRTHFIVPSGAQEVIQEAACRKQEFVENAWRLTIPQTSLMFTILRITPDLSSPSFTEDMIPYVQGVVHHMGEQAKKNLGEQTISQLEAKGIFLGLTQ